MWTDNYINIPFKPDGRDKSGADCYGLIYLVYKELLNIVLPSYAGVFKDETYSNLKRVSQTMRAERLKWKNVKEPKPFDVILLREGEFTWHCGLIIDKNKMLHVAQGIDSCIEHYKNFMWKNKIDGFLRYEKHNSIA